MKITVEGCMRMSCVVEVDDYNGTEEDDKKVWEQFSKQMKMAGMDEDDWDFEISFFRDENGKRLK